MSLEPKWKDKFDVSWCDLCDTAIISCNSTECRGTTCNCMGCELCRNDSDYKLFEKATTHVDAYLNEEEKVTYEKILYLKKYMLKSLRFGEYKIDWRRLVEEGILSPYSETLFTKEIEECNKISPIGEYSKPETHRVGCKCGQHNKGESNG